MKKILVTALTGALLAGCGGGGGSSATPPVSGTTGKMSQATLNFKFNNKTSISGQVRGRKYISRNTLGLGISYRPTGTSAVTFGTTEAALRAPTFATQIQPSFNSNLTTCTAADGTGAFSCTVVIAVPAGYDDFQFTTWDAAPGANGLGGTFGAGANDLSTATISNQYVVVNQNNVFSYALKGVVNSVALQLSTQSLISGATLGQLSNGTPINPASVTLAVLAKDYDGNIIIGSDPYVDVNGTPVTVNVSKIEAYPTVVGNAAPASGNVTFTTASVTGTGNACIGGATQTCTFVTPGSVPINYNGYDINSVTFNSNVTGGVAIPTIASAITFTRTVNGGGGGITVPSALTINVFGPTGPGGGVMHGQAGLDGNVWFANYGGDVHKVAPSGTITTYPTGSGEWDVTPGPDGKMWMADYYNSTIGRINTDGTGVTHFGPLTGVYPQSIIRGSDSNLWFTETAGAGATGNGYIAKITPAGVISEQQLTGFVLGGQHPVGIVQGSDGNYWFADNSGSIGRIAPDFSGQTNFTAVSNGGAVGSPYSVALGSDGNVWAADNGTARILKITPAGVITGYPVTGGNPLWIAAGPDGALWFVNVAGSWTIGRITTAGAITYFSPPASFVGNFWGGITAGPDGNVWFGGCGNRLIGKVNL